MLLFVALLIVPIVGYGLRYLMPLGEPVDTLRDVATACTLVGGIALVLVRLRVEQRLAEQANQRLRLLATACEQAGELIIIVGRDSRVEYANDAFCRATGYTHEELESIAPTRAGRRRIGGVDSALQPEPEGRQGDAPDRRRWRARTAARSRRPASPRRSSTPAAA